jgi:hypothetical protein
MTVTRSSTREQIPKLLVHTSASAEPIALEISGQKPEDILSTMLGKVGGGFQEVQATQEELDTLQELEEQKARAQVDSEKGKRKRMQMKKQQEMLAMASQGAI